MKDKPKYATGGIVSKECIDHLSKRLECTHAEDMQKMKSFLDDLYTGEEVSFTGTHKPDEPKEILRIGSSVELFFDGMKYNLIVESIEKDKSFNERAEDLLEDVENLKQKGFFYEINEWNSSVIYGSGYQVKHNGIRYISTDECNKPNAEENINKIPALENDKYWERIK